MAATEFAPGVSFGEDGRYRLERLLGTGGMASVWLARDSRLEREVAIKVLSDVLALDSDYVFRFEREARLAAGLSHPHLVNIFDFSAHGSRPYIVSEYVAGGTLAHRLRIAEAPAWDPVLLSRELLGALGYIHKAGIIHRDIKPANVLIGADGRARLTDFGIAQPSGATRITITGHVVGTERYIAPEVLRGGPSDERSDLYACGVLLSQCLSPGTSPRLGHLVSLLTEQDPVRRPRSADSALALLDGPSPTATRTLRRPPDLPVPRLPGRPTPGRPWVTRHGREIRLHITKGAAATALALAVLLAGLIILLSAGGGRRAAGSLADPPAGAPLTQQLDRLDRSINRSRR